MVDKKTRKVNQCHRAEHMHPLIHLICERDKERGEKSPHTAIHRAFPPILLWKIAGGQLLGSSMSLRHLRQKKEGSQKQIINSKNRCKFNEWVYLRA